MSRESTSARRGVVVGITGTPPDEGSSLRVRVSVRTSRGGLRSVDLGGVVPMPFGGVYELNDVVLLSRSGDVHYALGVIGSPRGGGFRQLYQGNVTNTEANTFKTVPAVVPQGFRDLRLNFGAIRTNRRDGEWHVIPSVALEAVSASAGDAPTGATDSMWLRVCGQNYHVSMTSLRQLLIANTNQSFQRGAPLTVEVTP